MTLIHESRIGLLIQGLDKMIYPIHIWNVTALYYFRWNLGPIFCDYPLKQNCHLEVAIVVFDNNLICRSFITCHDIDGTSSSCVSSYISSLMNSEVVYFICLD